MYSFAFWKPEVEKDTPDMVSPIWKDLNDTFLAVLSWSWLIYTIAVVIISICVYFAYCERCRRTEYVRRRRVIQRAQERPPQKRRPNAAYRDHQIYRHIILSVAKYMKDPAGIRPFIDHMDQLYPMRQVPNDEQSLPELPADEAAMALAMSED
ncbi:uncharacterized protein LOC115632165 [Scaptodrosophila lebanonensis]|uniref:Uncharacterized protein LOC115632165 n=1 Tax=Drosophila lebanonensis TaxID=7225 RepID=A0A6J2UD52_DROLE|nr:uncharacterized protein LOC115632165 [Scaptodrosophila lebanonensis]